MASNIFKPQDYQGIVKRIEKLESTNEKEWGKMSIVQMLEHCSLQLKLGLGYIELSGYEGPGIQRTWFGRKSFLYAMPWLKGMPTPSQMNMMKNDVSPGDFSKEKNQLINLLEEVQKNRSLKPHAFFGAMNQKDWGRLIWKHLDYHLKQFGG
ncbi:DUF1569 domain-containing protein [uncultured Winogradskyella sp.]|uniref:DUF1569 domain-containing protein n=1 Tax=uncultured Winogradskyella sp. TaxID=395353 RepID=UPI0026382646|nr:DUF1569 domain-containing protein [uncultured Winogradskyella sp.]